MIGIKPIPGSELPGLFFINIFLIKKIRFQLQYIKIQVRCPRDTP